jgi:hypothetical protein
MRALVALASSLECRAVDLAGCWMSESGLHTWAHNPHGDAAGLFQLMPATARGLGFKGDWKAFCALSVQQQLGWAQQYYGPHRGRLVTPGAVYLSTFLPALMSHASEPCYVLCSATLHPEWYRQNIVFDADHKGWITVGDLSQRIAKVTVGPRWEEFASRIRAAEQGAETLPELPTSEEFPANDSDPPPEAA